MSWPAGMTDMDPGSGRGGDRLKIALLGSRGIPATYSGFETFYEQLAVRLVARGHAVTVYNRAHHYRERRREYRGAHIVTVPSVPTKHLDTITHTAASLLHALPARHDVYYVCGVGNSPLCGLPRVVGRPCVLNVDGVDSSREKWGRGARWYLRAAETVACRVADVIIADSRLIEQRYMERYGRATLYIPYGANIWPRAREAASTGALRRWGLEPDGYVLFVSRLTPENRAHVLIEAFRRARTGLKLAVVGDAPYVEDYKRRLRSQCGENVVMTGYVFGDEYRQLSCHCRVFVLPSAIDGTRPVLLDQMGFGNCVVVRAGGANLEVVGDAGVAYDGEDEVAALQGCLEELSRDDARVHRYRTLAVERVRERYSWERVADQYEQLFRHLAAAGRAYPGAGSPTGRGASIHGGPAA